jgi:hypothetical protein
MLHVCQMKIWAQKDPAKIMTCTRVEVWDFKEPNHTKLFKVSLNSDCYLSMAVEPFVGLWALYNFLNFYAVGRTPWTGYQPVARPLPAHRTS